MMTGLKQSVSFGALAIALGFVATPAMAQQAGAPAQGSAAADKETDSDTIVVTGFRKSLQDSIETKRKADSIVDVISAEDVGKFPDRNVAESLSHLPGITVDHQFGVGEQVSIAGVEPALNRILIDGHSIASADWGGNPSDRSSRSFNYSLMSPQIISQAVVYKTPEARLQEGAIGASIDIVTRKPLDLKPNTITATGGYEYNDRSERGNFRGSALYSWHNADDTFGILGSVNYDRESLTRAGIQVFVYAGGSDFTTTNAAGQTVLKNPTATITGGTASDVAKAKYAAFLNHSYFEQTRQRIGYSGAVQWRPADNLTITATGLVIRGKYDNLSTSEYSYNYRADALTAVTVQNGILKSLSFGPTTGGAITGQLDTNFRRTRLKNDSFSMLFDWDLDQWKVSGNAGYTRASGGKNPEYLLNFRTNQGFTVSADGRNTSLNWQFDPSDTSKWYGARAEDFGNQTEPALLAKNNGQPFFGQQIGGITTADQTLDKEKFAQYDVSGDVELGPIKKALFGLRYSDHDNGNTTYGGATYTNQPFTLADLPTYQIPNGIFDGLTSTGNSNRFSTLTTENVIATLSRPGTISVTRSLSTNDYFRVNEKILSGYAQANFEFDKFRGNIGGRFVQTTDLSQYFQTNYYKNNPNDPNDPYIVVTTLTNAKRVDRRFLPSFNIAYEAGESVVLRGSAAKVIARPRYSDLAGSISLDDVTKTGGGGNPDLKPYAATNFGLSAEWYFARAGLIAGEVFYRDISNYINNRADDRTVLNTVTGVTQTYSISTPINGDKAKVTGFSLTVQAPLIWGFGIQSNYTFTSAETSDPARGLPFLSRDTYNIVPYFESGPFQARVSYNYRSKFLRGFGRFQAGGFADGYRQLDFSATYQITKNISVIANASNLLDETYYQYNETPEAPTDIYKNGRVFSLSANFKM